MQSSTLTALAGAVAGSLTTTTQRTLSPSQVSKWIDCQAAWWFAQCGLPDPPNANLALGRAIHSTLAAALNCKRQDVPLSLEEAASGLRAELDCELSQAVLAATDDTDQLHSQARAMLAAWWSACWHSTDAAQLELDLSGTLGGVKVRGIADVLTRDGVVIDWKTASRKPAGISPAHMLQLTTYAALTQTRQACVVTLTKTKAPACHIQRVTISNGHIGHAERLYQIAAEQMDAGLILPNRGSNFCSRANCAFVDACLLEFGGEVKE